MHAFAQTNLQLYRELFDAGYGEADLVRCDRAYRLAAQTFAGHFRSSGKPFLCHLVGTASILVRERAPGPVLAAALLHAAYQDEVSPTGTTGINAAMRRRLRALSPDVEALVGHYIGLSDDAAVLVTQSPDRDRRWLVLMRIANGLEDQLDGAAEVGSKRIFDLEAAAALAERLDAPALAALARELHAPRDRPSLPEALRSERVRSYAVHTPLRLRASRALHATAQRLRARARERKAG